MTYILKDLLDDLSQDINWNEISEKAKSANFDLRLLSDEEAEKAKKAVNEYFKRRKTQDNQDAPNIHYDVPHFCKPNS